MDIPDVTAKVTTLETDAKTIDTTFSALIASYKTYVLVIAAAGVILGFCVAKLI